VTRSTEELAKHRWHQTVDPAGPQHPGLTYARAVGRSDSAINRYAKGYALFIQRGSPQGGTLTIQAAIRLSEQSAEPTRSSIVGCSAPTTSLLSASD